MTSQAFWAEHQVGGPYQTEDESMRALRERSQRYPTLYDLMPVIHPGRTVLDFGCGPGHDSVLFSLFGAQVYYYDTSPLAMAMTLNRLEMHGVPGYPLTEETVMFDHIHCAGVLHHTQHPDQILSDLGDRLRPDGEIRLMVYDGDRSEHTQSEVPITRWWTHDDMIVLANHADLRLEYVGGYECSADWRPNCWAACYRLWH